MHEDGCAQRAAGAEEELATVGGSLRVPLCRCPVKWRNLQANPKISLVVDDLASVTPWKPRFVEIHGTAELLTSSDALGPGFSPEAIRIHPNTVHSWGLDD
ncbi:pyridoxamine 5'-phosphate oxidase family protein [Streptomyces sp. NPDC051664]|uniref:pyridoxamine 5'-phosphate oxidase family protein n=1 Tax=Streptomyces sp. NPDC051664 TaxID=3365668 RepID=UPI0037969645